MKFITLCGSHKFYDAFLKLKNNLESENTHILTPEIFNIADPATLTTEEHQYLDILHQSKMKMSDYVLIVNINGYIGKDTQEEIDWCNNHNIRVEYLEPVINHLKVNIDWTWLPHYIEDDIYGAIFEYGHLQQYICANKDWYPRDPKWGNTVIGKARVVDINDPVEIEKLPFDEDIKKEIRSNPTNFTVFQYPNIWMKTIEIDDEHYAVYASANKFCNDAVALCMNSDGTVSDTLFTIDIKGRPEINKIQNITTSAAIAKKPGFENYVWDNMVALKFIGDMLGYDQKFFTRTNETMLWGDEND